VLIGGDVVVHLFREVRSFYNLERMWGFGDEPVVITAPRKFLPGARRLRVAHAAPRDRPRKIGRSPRPRRQALRHRLAAPADRVARKRRAHPGPNSCRTVLLDGRQLETEEFAKSCAWRATASARGFASARRRARPGGHERADLLE
jgi:hypothetical protein